MPATTVVQRPPPDATDAESIQWLVDQNRRLQERLNALEARVEDLPDGWRRVHRGAVMGHRDSRTTERIYIHLFNRERVDEQVRIAMQSAMNL